MWYLLCLLAGYVGGFELSDWGGANDSEWHQSTDRPQHRGVPHCHRGLQAATGPGAGIGGRSSKDGNTVSRAHYQWGAKVRTTSKIRTMSKVRTALCVFQGQTYVCCPMSEPLVFSELRTTHVAKISEPLLLPKVRTIKVALGQSHSCCPRSEPLVLPKVRTIRVALGQNHSCCPRSEPLVLPMSEPLVLP